MSIETLLETIVVALPDTSRRGRKTIREACLCLCDGTWSVLAGGHPAVHIGEWGGDFQGLGETPEIALTACLKSIHAVGQSPGEDELNRKYP